MTGFEITSAESISFI